jgi:hypothetical protein
MSISFLTQRRTVLLMSDEALYVYRAVSRGRELVDTLPWDTEEFESQVAHLLDKECGKKPVVILNDMIEQHYRKERLSHRGVSVLDRKNVIRRKLNMAFPNYPVRASLQLKGGGDSKTDSTYLFAALSNSDQLSKTISAVRQSTVSVVGVFLLPVESADLLKKLAAKTVGKGQKSSPWTILISPHKGGGLRQIVVKNGELALTRMSLVDTHQEHAQQWAEDVYKEFEATMGYLSRFGYSADEGLNIIVISEPVVGDALQERMRAEHNYASLTPAQAGTLAGLSLGAGNVAEYYGDILHVAWAATKTKFIMPMQSAQVERIAKPRKIVAGLSILGCLLALFFVYQVINAQWSISQIKAEITELGQDKVQLEARYNKEIERVEQLGYDIKLIQAATAVYERLEGQRIDLLPILRSIGQALGRDLHLDEMILKAELISSIGGFIETVGQGYTDTQGAFLEKPFVATLIMKYPGTTDVETGNEEVRNLQKRLQLFLPRYTVEVTKYLKDYGYVDEVVVENQDMSKSDIVQDFVAEIRVRSKSQT